MISCTMVPREQAVIELYLNYPYVKSFIDRTGGRVDFSDFEKMAEQGKMSVWLAYDDEGERIGIMGVVIEDMAHVRVARIQFTAGKVGRGIEWLQSMFELIEDYARDLGCHKMEGIGRPGWRRLNHFGGWKEVGVMSEKDL